MFKWLGQVFYVIIAVLVKFVAGVLLLRLCLHQRWQRITIWTMLAVVAVFNAVYIFVVIFQCRPIQFYWFRYSSLLPPELSGGECHKTALATIPTYISFSMNVLTDWTLALLPVSFVWNAKMDRKTKFSVVGLLAIGSMFVCQNYLPSSNPANFLSVHQWQHAPVSPTQNNFSPTQIISITSPTSQYGAQSKSDSV